MRSNLCCLIHQIHNGEGVETFRKQNSDRAGQPRSGQGTISKPAFAPASLDEMVLMTEPRGIFTSLSAGGEMGERICAFDWGATSLGPPQNWSPSLKMMVRFLLANRFPVLIWWGPDFIQMYNDAYRPILGAKHPVSGLGRSGPECWPEIWHILQPLVETPFHGGESTWMEDIQLEINRHGFIEETHFTIAYSPVPDDSVPGGIGGVMATVHEITEKVVGERRVVALRDLGAQTVQAKTAEQACAIAASTLSAHQKDIPFVLFYLLEPDGRSARLAGHGGLPAGDPLAPLTLTLGSADEAWHIPEALDPAEMFVLEGLRKRFGSISPGPWADPPDAAVISVIPSHKAGEPAGFMIAGVSARLKLDQFYRAFFDFVRSQVATAIGNARAYEEESKRAQALAELDRAKTAFFSNVSHEFRTPLTLMLGPLDELLSKEAIDLPTPVKAQLEMVSRNGRRLLRLVNTLLDFSRIEAGRAQALYQPTDLAQLTADLGSVFRAATERAGLKLLINCAPLPEPVYVDRQMWEKIVLNLLSNAFKFTFSGEIEIRLQLAGRAAELRVRDTGVGVPPEELPRLFERFHRVQNSRSRTHEGSGIGLSLVQELVKLHGGAVTAESQLGKGTTFIVAVPLGAAHLPQDKIGHQQESMSGAAVAAPFLEEALRWLPDQAQPEAEEILSDDELVPSAARPSNPADRPWVLLADDNIDMRQYLLRLLADSYNVVAAADGAAAFESALRQPPDLILTDIMMPRLDGFALLKKLRADPLLRTIPVILLSARAGEESRVEGLQRGADDYLIKPFSSRALLARVAGHLELSRVRREAAERMRLKTEQFETLLNQAPMGVYLVDADFCLQQVNPAARPLFAGIPNLIGRDFAEVVHLIWHRDAADEIASVFRHTLQTGEPYWKAEQMQTRLAGGVPEYYEWRVDRITLPEGRFGVVCYFRDISSHVRARSLLDDANRQLQSQATDLEKIVIERTAQLTETIQELEAFSYSIAHDMRAPLRAMQSFASIVGEECSESISDEGKDYLRRIAASATRLDELIRGVLDYSRIVRDDYQLEPVDIAQFIRGIIESYPNLHKPAAEISIERDCFRPVLANRSALTQVVSNLLGNAVKFVRAGVRPSVRIWAVPADGRLRVWFADNGIGIPRELQGRIFLMFERLHPSSRYEGTGMGLAIVRKSLERMGGHVGVESEPGKGSRFWIELQRA